MQRESVGCCRSVCVISDPLPSILLSGLECLQQVPTLALHCHPTRCDDCAGHTEGVRGREGLWVWLRGRDCGHGLEGHAVSMLCKETPYRFRTSYFKHHV